MFYAQKRLMEIGILYMASKNMMRKILLLLFALVIAFIIWSFSVVGGKIVFRYTGNLELDGSKIESTDNLYNFKYVRELSLYDWKIDNFEYLEVMKKLEKLAIITDIDLTTDSNFKSISKCSQLEEFMYGGFVGCEIDNLLCFSEMNKLETLWLDVDKIRSIEGWNMLSDTLKLLYIKGVTNETYLNLKDFKNLESVTIDSDSLKEIIINNPKLTRLTLSIDSLEKISVSEECIKLEVVNINDCKRVEIDVDMFLKLESLKEIVIPKDSLNKSDINRLSNKGIEIESYDGTKKILY